MEKLVKDLTIKFGIPIIGRPASEQVYKKHLVLMIHDMLPTRRLYTHRDMMNELIKLNFSKQAKKLWTKEVRVVQSVAFRLKSAGGEPSTHCWGYAIDINPVDNPRSMIRISRPTTLTKEFQLMMKDFFNLGDTFIVPDPMHFQLRSIGK